MTTITATPVSAMEDDETKDNAEGDDLAVPQDMVEKDPEEEDPMHSPQSEVPALDESAANHHLATETPHAPPTPEDKPTLETAANGSGPTEITPPSKNQPQQELTLSSSDDAKMLDSDSGAVADADDGDSSNDDSSYFADPSNLPSPKSGGRRYSYSSNNSTGQQPFINQSASNRDSAAARESDASLSLSESDEEDHHRTAPRGTPDVYPQRITRVHSVGSLISTSSHNSEEPMIHDELNRVATANRNYIPGEVATGRLSPVQALNFATTSTPTSQMASPPTILPFQYQYPPQNYPHPMAQQPPMNASTEDWIAAMASQQQQLQQQQELQRGSVTTSASGRSDGTSLNYSDDGEIHAFQQNIIVKGSSEKSKASSSDRSASRRQANGRSNGASSSSSRAAAGTARVASSLSRGTSDTRGGDDEEESDDEDGTYQVYWQRWIMLMYMSVLNLLSDWTCYSVAPIALLTQQAFGNINPEELVVVFLGANAVATACEPIILSRLGLRRTVLFGALLLMVGSIIKSGGMPPIIQADLEKGKGEWRVYLGFFLVGLSQPLYQCTPALLSASWFPEKERTMATGVALNANQLGIGFAFIFGTLLVAKSDDIPAYFGLLSQISTIAFFGALFQFQDAPPTPPSQTARVVRGDLDIRMPSVRQVLESIGISGRSDMQRDIDAAVAETRKSGRSTTSATSKTSGSGRRSRTKPSSKPHSSKVAAPSPAPWDDKVAAAPSPMREGTVAPPGNTATTPGREAKEEEPRTGQRPSAGGPYSYGQPPYYGAVPPPPPQMGQMGYPFYPGMPYNPPLSSPLYGESSQPVPQYGNPQPGSAPYSPLYASGLEGSPYGQDGGSMPTTPYNFSPPGYSPYPMPVFDQQSGQYVYPPPVPPVYSSQGYYGSSPYYQGFPGASPGFGTPYSAVPKYMGASLDEGAEPVLTVTPHHLDINIRDDQVILSIRACASRPGFIHALVSFTVSGIVINTLSTFMDYLVRLNGAGREMTGIVGGTFQFVIMISSLLIGGMTDRSRAYYSVTVGMLVLGAFGLAECGVSLSSDRGGDLRWALVIVAVLVGPLQPVSTELGVEVVYPLSENTVLVIQQLFSNLLSALFIPCFKKMKDIGISQIDTSIQQPEYTFSFYLLIVLHAGATVFFATFNGRYLRYEHELLKKEEQERKEEERAQKRSLQGGERQPLIMQHPLV